MALDFVAGCLGGASGVIVGHPLDTVKVRLQIQGQGSIKYRGTFQTLATIIKQESVLGAYKGITSPLCGVAAVNAVLFGVYGILKPYVAGDPGNDALWAHFVAGSISGSVQSLICSPMELVKTRMQLNESKRLNCWTILKQLYQKEGGIRRGIFKGWVVTLAREIPAFGTYFATYEALTTRTGYDLGTFGMMMSGGIAGVASWVVCFPMDVVKTRYQSDLDGKYRGAWDCTIKTYQQEGLRAFSRGLSSTVIRAFPVNVATFSVVAWTMKFGDSKAEEISNGRQKLENLISDWEKSRRDKPHGILCHQFAFKIPHLHALPTNCVVNNNFEDRSWSCLSRQDTDPENLTNSEKKDHSLSDHQVTKTGAEDPCVSTDLSLIEVEVIHLSNFHSLNVNSECEGCQGQGDGNGEPRSGTTIFIACPLHGDLRSSGSEKGPRTDVLDKSQTNQLFSVDFGLLKGSMESWFLDFSRRIIYGIQTCRCLDNCVCF